MAVLITHSSIQLVSHHELSIFLVTFKVLKLRSVCHIAHINYDGQQELDFV